MYLFARDLGYICFDIKSAVKNGPLNDAQLMVLKVVKDQYDEKDPEDLRKLLIDFNDRKMQEHLDKFIDEKGYTDAGFEKMSHGHGRQAC
ncbi:hypothetical protein [Mucilaginibacter myungsuensis]|uniref:Uncharacterized protein n=1 Tax=Mucilaginibacter myungsuensis TaxID=649104 RepID=A0A929PXI5_9SPHI|nr:hypothetical protein [Mucilaginibacter myungsuensis]MBE9662435.1 hypothetical protein [Mucilaginibacter myungsuensis]MDN3599128.1 hypothetical protein [Mucilaginibacter myungsuensis]